MLAELWRKKTFWEKGKYLQSNDLEKTFFQLMSLIKFCSKSLEQQRWQKTSRQKKNIYRFNIWPMSQYYNGNFNIKSQTIVYYFSI